jgi:ERCC4-type nuclease
VITSVLIDSREPQEIQDLKFGDVPTVVTQLQVGDAIIGTKDGCTLAIERKTPGDLLGSIKDRRLFHQCAAMREVSDWCYLVIVGRMSVVKDNQVRTDALLSVQESGVGVVQTLDYKAALVRLSKRSRDDVKIMPRRLSEPLEPDAAFLAGLPSVRATRAMDLLAKCGSAASALDWLSNIHDDYGIRIKGIGSNQKSVIHSLLGLKEKEYLTINLWEDEQK